MKQKLILIVLIMATMDVFAQSVMDNKASEQLLFFKQYVDIPEGYTPIGVTDVMIDGKSAYLFRYEKGINKGLGGEHFSFIVTHQAPFVILGFTTMDSKYVGEKELSEQETEKIAKNFLQKIDPLLSVRLEAQWIDRHHETVLMNKKQYTVRGMKYKCYRQSDKDYAWVIVGGDGSIVTFERDILWSNGMQRRITEKWLHDSWLQSEEKAQLLTRLESDFLNGAVNELNTEGMRRLFHPDFAILIANGEKLNRLPLNTWINVIEEYKSNKEKMNSGLRDNITHTYEIVDITGSAAVIKLQLYRGETIITTDYVSLLKFSDGWKIVAKISNEHITNPFNI